MLTRVSDIDGLHDLIAAKGVEILELPFPYLVVAARNRARDQVKRHLRETSVSFDDVPDLPASPSLWDPVELVATSDELGRTLKALADMDDRDVLVIWLAAQGKTSEEIVATWDELGFTPRHPEVAAIRQRRKRARAALKRRAHIDR